MTRVDSCDHIGLGAFKLIGHRSSFFLGPYRGASDAFSLFIPLAIGPLCCPVGMISQTKRIAIGFFNAGWCLIDRDTVQDWSGLGISDGHPDIATINWLPFDQSAVSHSWASSIRNPLPIHCHINGEARNPLAFLDGFFELYHIKMLFFSKIENKRSGLGIISRSPTGLFIAICQMAGLVERIASCWVSFYQSSCRIVHTVELVQGLTEFFQTGYIGIRKFPILVGWNIKQE